jgi:Excreted virulence factor EspC, type VII ESX diderm
VPATSGSVKVRHAVLTSVAAAMRADAADLDAVIERLRRAVGATSSLGRWPAGQAFNERAEAALAALQQAGRRAVDDQADAARKLTDTALNYEQADAAIRRALARAS